MTVNVQVPYNSYLGNGSIELFSFTFGLIEPADLFVLVGGVAQIQDIDYTVQPSTAVAETSQFWKGGDVVFTVAPASGVEVLIFRKTTISQQLDYTASAFPSETHEEGLDKLIFILQELITGVLDGNLTFDLSTEQGESTVTILNSGGTDALLPSWVSGLLAGVFHGEITGLAPDDNSATTKPDGFTWYEI